MPKAIPRPVATEVTAQLQGFVNAQGGSVFTSSPSLVLQQIKVHDSDRYKRIAAILTKAGYDGALAKRTPSYKAALAIFQDNLEHWDYKMWMKGTAPRPQLPEQQTKQKGKAEEVHPLDRMFAAMNL